MYVRIVQNKWCVITAGSHWAFCYKNRTLVALRAVVDNLLTNYEYLTQDDVEAVDLTKPGNNLFIRGLSNYFQLVYYLISESNKSVFARLSCEPDRLSGTQEEFIINSCPKKYLDAKFDENEINFFLFSFVKTVSRFLYNNLVRLIFFFT